MTNFSIFLPRIDTRSLPSMSEHTDQASYEAACIARIKSVFADQGIGTPTQVSLLRKYTPEQYLFFVGFVHFETGLALTPAAERFRTDLQNNDQAQVPLPAAHYWLVHPYRSRSAPKDSTLSHQHRLLNPSSTALVAPSMQRQKTPHSPLPRPTLVRDGGRVLPVFRSDSDDEDTNPIPDNPYTALGLPASPQHVLAPSGFASWLSQQPPAVRTGYGSALSSGQMGLISQYHEQAV